MPASLRILAGGRHPEGCGVRPPVQAGQHSSPLPYSRPRVAPVWHAQTGSFMAVFGWDAGPQRPPRAADRRRGRPTRAAAPRVLLETSGNPLPMVLKVALLVAAPRVLLETSGNPAPGTVRLMRCAPCGGLGRATGVAFQAKLNPRLGGDARRASSNVEYE